MVDKSLVEEMRAKINSGATEANADDALKSFELIKQISKEVDYLKGDVEESDYTCQIIFTDLDKGYWIKVSKGDVTYDEGKLDNPSIKISCSKDIGLGMLFGEVDPNILSPLGKLKVEGKFKHFRSFQELYEDVLDEFKKRY